MLKRHPDNERIKHRYFEFLKQADGKSEQTIRQIEKAILRFEEFTGFADLKLYNGVSLETKDNTPTIVCP